MDHARLIGIFDEIRNAILNSGTPANAVGPVVTAPNISENGGNSGIITLPTTVPGHYGLGTTPQRFQSQLPSPSLHHSGNVIGPNHQVHPNIGFPATPDRILAEARQRFTPYSTSPSMRLVGRQNRAIRTETKVPTWSKGFCCLSSPEDLHPPDAFKVIHLNSMGLGENILELDWDATSLRIIQRIKDTYPSLNACEFELMKAMGTGSGRMLVRVSATEQVPSVQKLRTLRNQAIFIRPFSDLDHVDGDEDTEHDFGNGVVNNDNHGAVRSGVRTPSSLFRRSVCEELCSPSSGRGWVGTVLGRTPSPISTRLSTPLPIDGGSGVNERSTTSLVPGGSRVTEETTTSPNPVGSAATGVSTSSTIGQANIFERSPRRLRDDIMFDDDDSIASFDTFRRDLYLQHPGREYITINRSSEEGLLRQVLGIFKNPNFNFLKKPFVEFENEPGVDMGAISKQFFWKGAESLLIESFEHIRLFEGEQDHYIPSADISLFESDVFFNIGQFLAYAGIHDGVSFLGLSAAVVDYLLLPEVDSGTISIEDVPDAKLRDALTLMMLWYSGATITTIQKAEVISAAMESDYNAPINAANAKVVAHKILYHEVIRKRKVPLDAMKRGFSGYGIGEYVVAYPYLRDAIFPRSTMFELTPEIVISSYEQRCSDLHFAVVTGVTKALTSVELKKFLLCLTGSGMLTGNRILIRADSSEGATLGITACSGELVIPDGVDHVQLYEVLRFLKTEGYEGFDRA